MLIHLSSSASTFYQSIYKDMQEPTFPFHKKNWHLKKKKNPNHVLEEEFKISWEN